MDAKAEPGLEVGVGGVGIPFDAEAVLGDGRRDLPPRGQQTGVDHERLSRSVWALHHRLDERQGSRRFLLTEKGTDEPELQIGVSGGQDQRAAVFDFGLVGEAVGEE